MRQLLSQLPRARLPLQTTGLLVSYMRPDARQERSKSPSGHDAILLLHLPAARSPVWQVHASMQRVPSAVVLLLYRPHGGRVRDDTPVAYGAGLLVEVVVGQIVQLFI